MPDSEQPRTRELLEPLLQIIARAGAAVMDVYSRAQHDSASAGVQLKADDSPVTRADLAANDILTSGLRTLTPQFAVVSEEDPASHSCRTARGCFWLLDPVDGTREFLNRTDEFTVNVALIRDSEPVFGVVQAPALAQTYWGGRDVGAWRVDRFGRHQLQVAAYPARDAHGQFERPLRIVASRNHLTAQTRALIDELTPHELVRTGSSLKFCRIAEGSADYYPRHGPTSEWDTAAAQAVVEAAGGQVLTMSGERLCYGKPDVLNPDFQVTGQPAD